MPLCARCHQNEATIHFTSVVDGAEDETIDLCKDCAPLTVLKNLALKELEALSVIWKKCEFCGELAHPALPSPATRVTVRIGRKVVDREEMGEDLTASRFVGFDPLLVGG